MPYQWVEPEVAINFNGKTIYHVYKNDRLDCRMTYWFTTEPLENGKYEFDIRDLKIASTCKSLESKLIDIITYGMVEFP